MACKKLIPTSALAKKMEIPVKDLFEKLSQYKLIEKDGSSWVLTDIGKEQGGEYKELDKYGKFFVWPEDLKLTEKKEVGVIANKNVGKKSSTKTKLISSTKVGDHFVLSPIKVNYILSELGWIKKSIKGWVVTEQGMKQQGGVQSENNKTGVPFALWPEAILQSKSLIETINHIKGKELEVESKKEAGVVVEIEAECVGFREKYEAKHRATDGHFVRSKAEMLIDNWLYMAEIVHAYERKLPIEEDVYSDFYIPTGKVYIEYWGYENEEKYLVRKKKKQDIYKKYGFNLIELEEKEVQNLDDFLPKLLLKHGVQAY